MKTLAIYAKAIAGGLVSGLSVLLATNDWNAHAYVAAVVAFLLGLGVVGAVKNAPAKT